MALTTLVALALTILVAIKLARRILLPLTSVAESLRRIAEGDLEARAITEDRSLGEAAVLVDDFNAMAERLQRMAQEQMFWNAAIAHELRTPVTILRGRLQGLAEGVFTPDESQFRRLLSQVDGLSRLIEDLRVVSLVESGHLDLQVQKVDLAVEVRAGVEFFKDALQAAGQYAVLELDERCVECDPVRIRQALFALLENARRHAVPGTVRVQTEIVAGWCRLCVEDEGPGIPEALAPHVFKAFRRTGDARPSTGGGSGLGLAVVAAIAHAHGGRPSVVRQPTAALSLNYDGPSSPQPARCWQDLTCLGIRTVYFLWFSFFRADRMACALREAMQRDWFWYRNNNSG